MHVGIAGNIIVRNWIDFVHRLNTRTVRNATLEAPKVFAACIETEAYKVAAATSFHIELFAPFVDEDVVINRS